jgi:hypothetical protein
MANTPLMFREAALPREISARAVENIPVDVSEAPKKISINRGGTDVTPPPVNTTKVDDFVGGLVPIDRFLIPRVISQTVPAGTRVARGTVIDVVLVPVRDINVGLIDGTHDGLKTKAIADVLPIVQDDKVKAVLDKGTDPTALSAEDKKVLTDAASQKLGATVDESTPSKGFNALFNSFQSVRSFG